MGELMKKLLLALSLIAISTVARADDVLTRMKDYFGPNSKIVKNFDGSYSVTNAYVVAHDVGYWLEPETAKYACSYFGLQFVDQNGWSYAYVDVAVLNEDGTLKDTVRQEDYVTRITCRE